MKRSPLKRRTALKRKSMKRSAPKATDNPERLVWVRSMRCARCGGVRFSSQSEAHHPTGAGWALKAPDADAIPLCWGCHRDFHALTDYFNCWTKDQLRRWQAGQVEVYRVRWETRCHG